MRIRMKIQMSGSRNGQHWPAAGGVVDVPDREGASYCASGLAEPVRDLPAVETAAVEDDSESTAKSETRRRSRRTKTKSADEPGSAAEDTDSDQ